MWTIEDVNTGGISGGGGEEGTNSKNKKIGDLFREIY
jgi:hypothetical protein